MFDRQTGTTRLVTHRYDSPTAAAYWSSPDDFAIAPGGEYAVYSYSAADIVANDYNGTSDVFLWDTATGINTAITRPVGPTSVTAGGAATSAGVSRDGRYAVFASMAANVVPGMAPGVQSNIFLKDLQTGITTLVSHTHDSLTTAAGQSTNPVISGDGRYVAYCSGSTLLVPGFIDGNGDVVTNYKGTDVYLYDRVTGINTLVSRTAGTAGQGGNGVSGVYTDYDTLELSIDDAGRRVVYRSQATDLVPGYVDGNGADTYGLLGNDLFMFDRLTGQNVLVNHRFDSATTSSNQESTSPVISGDGSAILYYSLASDVVAGYSGNANYQTFLFDSATGTTEMVSHAASGHTVSSGGYSQGYKISQNGRWVAHNHNAANIVAGQIDTNGGADLFLYDRVTGENTLISRSFNDPNLAVGGGAADISDDGRWIAFGGVASKTVPGATSLYSDIILYDRIGQDYELVSHIPGQPLVGANRSSVFPAISGNGRVVTWFSKATDLAPGMTLANPARGNDDQVYSYDRLTGQVTLLTRSVNDPMRFGNDLTNLEPLQINGTGSVIAFRSTASDLVIRDYNGFDDVFAYVTPPPTITSMKVADGTAQRSVVRSLTVTFDQPVTFAGDPAGAFVVRRGSETVALSAAVTTGTATTVTLTFSGPGTQFGSLVDGRYSLTVLSNQVLGIEA
ncbi:MAG: hypothetical protein K1X57_12650, partial [Gemmataceae bacterium]|nr:hypothetical protein [Gemmataceae bacterium]